MIEYDFSLVTSCNLVRQLDLKFNFKSEILEATSASWYLKPPSVKRWKTNTGKDCFQTEQILLLLLYVGAATLPCSVPNRTTYHNRTALSNTMIGLSVFWSGIICQVILCSLSQSPKVSHGFLKRDVLPHHSATLRFSVPTELIQMFLVFSVMFTCLFQKEINIFILSFFKELCWKWYLHVLVLFSVSKLSLKDSPLCFCQNWRGEIVS